MDRVILANKFFIPSSMVDPRLLREWTYEWTDVTYRIKENEYGEPILDEFDEPVKEAVSEQKQLLTYRQSILRDGTIYLEIPRGDMIKLRPLLKIPHEDLRPLSSMGFKLRMSPKTLSDFRWPDQRRCAEEYIEAGYGIIKGDPGSGKTVMGVAVVSKLSLTTFVLSTLRDGTEQWIESFRQHTNIDELEAEYGRKLIGPYKRGKKNNIFPITVSTVQAFLRENGQRFLQQNRDAFSLLVLDEVHNFGAPKYSQIVQAINPFAILGLTATTERDDNLHKLVFDLVGPVVAVGKAKQMPPTVYFIGTDIKAPGWIYKKNFPPHYQWNIILEHLAKCEERYNTIIKYLYRDIDDGRHVLVIGERRDIIKEVYRRLMQDGYAAEYVDGDVRVSVRKQIYKRVKDGTCKVLCAGKVLKELVDIPNVDCLHFVTPVSSKLRATQIYGRTRRWLAGKSNPIIRDYVDGAGAKGQLTGSYQNRLKLCKAQGWAVKTIEVDGLNNTGISQWRPYEQFRLL